MQTVEFPSKPSKFVACLLAMRPKTLVTSIVPVAVGTFLATTSGMSIDWSIAFSALLSILFINIGTNVINDALDFKRGSDTKERLGFKRMTQAGYLSFNTVFTLGIACFSLAFLFAIPFLIKGGIPLLILLILSILCGYFYTGGPWPLAYNGLSDLFVLIFFGWVATCSCYYLQTDFIDIKSFLAGTQLGLLSTVLLAINNLRDIQGDRKANKKTLAVRFGKTFARCEITFLIMSAFALNVAWVFLGFPKATGLPFASLPLAMFLIRHVWVVEPSAEYNRFFGWAALLHLSFGIFLVIGLAWR